MSWIKNHDLELFITFITHTKVPMLISGANGEIYWANKAFELFSGYSNWEIENKLKWENLSINDENIEADRHMIHQCILGTATNYSIKKQIIPKNERPAWTDVHVSRFPMTGDFKFFLITIQPLQNGTAPAFSLAIDTINQFSQQTKTLQETLSSMEDRIVDRVGDIAKPVNEVEQIAMGFGRLAYRYPKASFGVLIVFVGMLLGNQFFEALHNLKQLFGF